MALEFTWSCLNLAIGKSASSRLSFEFIGPLNGAEVWRKLVPTNSKRLHRRGALRVGFQNPTPSPTMAGIMGHAETFYNDMMCFFLQLMGLRCLMRTS